MLASRRGVGVGATTRRSLSSHAPPSHACPPREQTNTCKKHYLPATSFAGCNKLTRIYFLVIWKQTNYNENFKFNVMLMLWTLLDVLA